MKRCLVLFLLAGCTELADTADGGMTSGWRAIALPADQAEARVTGIHCETAARCVVATDPSGANGKVLALADGAIGATLIDGQAVAPKAHVLGDVGFLGLERTRDGLTARIDASGAWVAATGDVMATASWQAVTIGTVDGSVINFLNAQEALQRAGDGEWLMINRAGYVFRASAPPGVATAWTRLWSPTSAQPEPADFATRYAADPTLCESDVSTRMAPTATQNVFVSRDLDLVIHPAGGLNQEGGARPGVCISTDRGRTFREVPFTGLPEVQTQGPIAVTCLDRDRCFAYNGLFPQTGSAYVYFTRNASAGVASQWTRATLPADLATEDDAQPRALFFAPDGMHGWLAGARDGGPMLLATSDGGATWTDASAPVKALTSRRLHAGFALSPDQVWLGGEGGTLLALTP